MNSLKQDSILVRINWELHCYRGARYLPGELDTLVGFDSDLLYVSSIWATRG